MSTKTRNRAKVPQVTQLKEEVKTISNQDAREQELLDASLASSQAALDLLKAQKDTSHIEQSQASPDVEKAQLGASSSEHIIALKSAPDEAEEKKKKQYATSMNNTLNTCGTFIALATSYGPDYVSSVPLYEIPNLQSMRDDGYTFMKGVDNAETTYNYAVAARMGEFDGLAPLCALVVAEMVIIGAAQETIDQLRTLIRLLRGDRKVPKDMTDPTKRYKSVSHMNYDDLTANFGRLILMIAADPNYNPAAAALKLVALNAKLDALITANNAVQVATAALDAARIARNEFFNATSTGLCDVFNTAKNVVLTNFGRSSEQYKKVKGLAFRKIRIK